MAPSPSQHSNPKPGSHADPTPSPDDFSATPRHLPGPKPQHRLPDRRPALLPGLSASKPAPRRHLPQRQTDFSKCKSKIIPLRPFRLKSSPQPSVLLRPRPSLVVRSQAPLLHRPQPYGTLLSLLLCHNPGLLSARNTPTLASSLSQFLLMHWVSLLPLKTSPDLSHSTAPCPG